MRKLLIRKTTPSLEGYVENLKCNTENLTGFVMFGLFADSDVKIAGEISYGLCGHISRAAGIFGLSGIISRYLTGNISYLHGVLRPDLKGDATGISGDVTSISGDFNQCMLTSEDRERGVNIQSLIRREEE